MELNLVLGEEETLTQDGTHIMHVLLGIKFIFNFLTYLIKKEWRWQAIWVEM